MMTSQQSYQPWHLKYRPQNLSELVGQPLIVRTLTNELKTGGSIPFWQIGGKSKFLIRDYQSRIKMMMLALVV
ncbi:hypothetical protein [Coleofasciculus sp. E1-EBD-02]|uniref:hypothetical protein n=1 Tax=Coleofasciculus sp. E1-EBD-02 TaxID=3068481 RepID=UPI0032FA42F0